MTFERLFYEYRPYAMAILGLYASTQLPSTLAVSSGCLLLGLTTLIGFTRYNYRISSVNNNEYNQFKKSSSKIKTDAYIKIK